MCGCNSGTHSCPTGSACYSNTDADHCGERCLDCSAHHGTTNTCSNNQCACDVSSLACGANVPTCGSWDFDSGTVEGWKVGSYYAKEQHGTTTGLSTLVVNGSPVLTAKFDNRTSVTRGVAEFSVDLCPGATLVDVSKYVFKYDVFFKTTAGRGFTGLDGNDGTGPDTFLANGGAVILGCQPFLYPASDTWEEGSCWVGASATNMNIVIRFSSLQWAGDIYIDNVRFEPM